MSPSGQRRFLVQLVSWLAAFAASGSSLPMAAAMPPVGHVMQHLAMEPQDQIAEIGARVTLPCRVVNKQGVLQWTRDDFGLGTRRQLAGFERYAMIGSDEEGDYSLQIYPVEMEDDAQFQCQVSASGHDHPSVRSRYATLTVLVAPDNPVITQGDVFQATEDREIELECVSANGKPAAEITWIDGFGSVLTAGISYLLEPAADMRRFTARSILRLTPTKEMHGRTVVCQAQNTVDKTFRTAAIRLEVQYAPKVVVAIVAGALETGQIPDGGAVEAMCTVDANPPDVQYRWWLGEEQLEGQEGAVVQLANVTRAWQNALLKCVAQNAIGISSDSESFDVIYQPFFTRRPDNIEADSLDEITLQCEVDGNPLPEIIWVFDPSDRANRQPRVVGTSPILHLIAATDTAGRYFCKANSPGFAEIRAEAQVLLKAPPRIVSANEQYALGRDGQSESVEIECIANSVPKANHVSWAYNGKLIDFSVDVAFEMREQFIPNGVRSTLAVEGDYQEYLGLYSCIVINSYGSDTLDIMFREPERLSPVILAAGSALLLLILIAGIASIAYCMRCSRQKVLPPADLIPKESVITMKAHSIAAQSPHSKSKSAAAAAAAAAASNGHHQPGSPALGSHTTVGSFSPGKAVFRQHGAPPPQTMTASMAAAAGMMCTSLDAASLSPGLLDGLPEYQESNSGSYSTTTTISINKNDLLLAAAGGGGGGGGGRMTLPHPHHHHQQQSSLSSSPSPLPAAMLSSFSAASGVQQPRFSSTFGDNLSIHTNQSSIIGLGTSGGASYVDYARDFYSPTVQQNNANHCVLQQQQQQQQHQQHQQQQHLLQRDPPTYV